MLKNKVFLLCCVVVLLPSGGHATSVDPLTLIWQTCGAGCPEAPEVVVAGKTISVGVVGRPEDGIQNMAQHVVSALLPPAASYTITFAYNLSTWDSYNTIGTSNPPFNGGTGFWDAFLVSVTSTPYYNLTLADPDLPNLGFLWGGSSFGDDNAAVISGTKTVTIKGDLSNSNYLNIGLDTATSPETDDAYPSWGKFTVVSIVADNSMTDIPRVAGVPAYYQAGDPNQLGYPGNAWGNNIYDSTTATIRKEGCTLTTIAMVLSKYGYPYNPGTLNTALGKIDGFTSDGLVKWPAVSALSGNTLEVKYAGSQDTAILDADLAAGRPVVLDVGGHFVLAVGKSAGVYDIVDPGSMGRTTLAAYNNKFVSMRRFVHPGTGSFVVYANPGTQVLVTDPLGRQVGIVGETIVNEVPESVYVEEGITDDDLVSGPDRSIAPHPTVFIATPPQGFYRLTLTRPSGGQARAEVYRYNSKNWPQSKQIYQMNLKPGESVDQTTTYSTRTGDLNGDGFVNQLDLQIVRASFGKRLGQAGYDPAADTNADNVIDIRDLALVGRFDPPPREPSNPPR